MLADKFQQAVDKLQADAAKRQEERTARDDFIETKFPELDTAFSAMVGAVTGSHARLAVVKTAVTETFTGRGFATLNETVIEVRSTLYGSVEGVRFTPGLETIAPDQFGVIKVALDNLAPSFAPNGPGPLFKSMAERGILMRGTVSAALVVAKESGFEPLTPALLESFLTALFIRT